MNNLKYKYSHTKYNSIAAEDSTKVLGSMSLNIDTKNISTGGAVIGRKTPGPDGKLYHHKTNDTLAETVASKQSGLIQ